MENMEGMDELLNALLSDGEKVSPDPYATTAEEMALYRTVVVRDKERVKKLFTDTPQNSRDAALTIFATDFWAGFFSFQEFLDIVAAVIAEVYRDEEDLFTLADKASEIVADWAEDIAHEKVSASPVVAWPNLRTRLLQIFPKPAELAEVL